MIMAIPVAIPICKEKFMDLHVVTVRNITQNDVGTCSWHKTEAGALARAEELQKLHDAEYERFLEYKIMSLPLED